MSKWNKQNNHSKDIMIIRMWQQEVDAQWTLLAIKTHLIWSNSVSCGQGTSVRGWRCLDRTLDLWVLWGGCPSVGTGGGVIDWASVGGLSWTSYRDPPIHHVVHTQEKLLPDGQHCSWATLADAWRTLEDPKCYWQQPQTTHNFCICASVSTRSESCSTLPT